MSLALAALLAAAPARAALVSEWVLPPGAASAPASGVALGVEPRGALCLAAGGRVFFYPGDDLLLMTEKPVSDFFWLPDGVEFARSGKAMGFLTLAPVGESRKRLLLRFDPLVSVPYDDWRMYPGAGGVFFVAGRKAADGRTEISRWRSPGAPPKKGAAPAKPARMLYAVRGPVSAVAGSAETAYFASEKAVFRLDAGSKEPRAVFVHPSLDIRELAFVPGAGLFYATDEGVGFVGPRGGAEILKARGAQIRAAGRALYVLLGGLPGGVLRLKGLESLSQEVSP